MLTYSEGLPQISATRHSNFTSKKSSILVSLSEAPPADPARFSGHYKNAESSIFKSSSLASTNQQPSVKQPQKFLSFPTSIVVQTTEARLVLPNQLSQLTANQSSIEQQINRIKKLTIKRKPRDSIAVNFQSLQSKRTLAIEPILT